MVRKFGYADIKTDGDILPLLILGGNLGLRSKKALFDACKKFYLAQHPEISEDLGEIYFRDFIKENFDNGTLLASVPGVAFSCFPRAVTSSKEARKNLAKHEQAKANFMWHYKEFGLEYK